MSKQKPSDNKQKIKPEVPDETVDPGNSGLTVKATAENSKPDNKSDQHDQSQAIKKDSPEVKPAVENEVAKPEREAKPAKVSRGFPYFGVFNLLLIIGIVAAAGYYWQTQ